MTAYTPKYPTADSFVAAMRARVVASLTELVEDAKTVTPDLIEEQLLWGCCRMSAADMSEWRVKDYVALFREGLPKLDDADAHLRRVWSDHHEDYADEPEELDNMLDAATDDFFGPEISTPGEQTGGT